MALIEPTTANNTIIKLNELKINSVDTQKTFEAMKKANKVNANELYFIEQETGVDIEYIVSTQTEATNQWTGVSKDINLYQGKIIAYHLKQDCLTTGTNYKLGLTLGDGTNLTAVSVYQAYDSSGNTENTYLTEFYPAGTILLLMYTGTTNTNGRWVLINKKTISLNKTVTSTSKWQKILLNSESSTTSGAAITNDGQINTIHIPESIEVSPGYSMIKAKTFTAGHYSNTTSGNSNKYYKIKINSTSSWMFAFTVRIYHNYDWQDIVISGYNYSSTKKWYDPRATILGANHSNEITVTFGHDGDNELWVAIPANSYSGVDIINVTNGHTQIGNVGDLFTITLVESLSGTIDKEIKNLKRPASLNDIVVDNKNETLGWGVSRVIATINGTDVEVGLPTNPNVDTKNTAGSTDTSEKIYLVGAMSQTTSVQTYSDDQVYTTNGQLNGNSIRIADQVTLQYNSTTQALDFIFA